MALKSRELAEKNLQQGDSIQKTYEGKVDGNRGYLMMSKQKLLFYQEEGGFLKKSYNLKLDLPYVNIESVTPVGSYLLDIVETNGKKHEYRTFDITTAHIQASFKELLPIPKAA